MLLTQHSTHSSLAPSRIIILDPRIQPRIQHSTFCSPLLGVIKERTMETVADNLRSLLVTNNGDNDVVCGESISRSLTMTGECIDNDCERTFHLYIPNSLCANDQADILPLVFAIHCLGCTGSTMMHWIDEAEKFNFVLVIPEGIQGSWNARYCCGYSLEKNVNDVGFLDTVITQLSTEFTFVSKDFTYAMGWSNGGFMVMYAAQLFRAIAPISGYQYEDLLPAVVSSNNKPVGLFMHHSEDDRFVRITGCCTDSSMPHCCCGISNHADQCTSAQQIHQQWATQVNHCAGDTQVSFLDEAKGIVCLTATGGDCQANTTFCAYQHGGHFNSPSFKKAFPMTTQIADFFARDACSIYGGSWSLEQKNCACQNTQTKGTYCLVVAGGGGEMPLEPSLFANKADIHGAESSSSFTPMATSLATALGLALLLLAGATMFFFKSKERKRYDGFSKVSSVELRSM
jgi:poly(3-hydroxybutyrate) depolymerase